MIMNRFSPNCSFSVQLTQVETSFPMSHSFLYKIYLYAHTTFHDYGKTWHAGEIANAISFIIFTGLFLKNTGLDQDQNGQINSFSRYVP